MDEEGDRLMRVAFPTQGHLHPLGLGKEIESRYLSVIMLMEPKINPP